MAKEKVQTEKRGAQVLNSSLLNKGTAFTEEERSLLGLDGLLPPCASTIEQQIKRSYLHFSQKRTPLEKYESLVSLMSRNELLFYQFISKYPAEVLPIIYTPTVGDAAMQYSRIYFHQRGLYLSYTLKGRLDEAFSNYALSDVEVIVVTDGERILGLGDQGIGGMTIPIGKLSLYTLFGGIHPAKTLPIILDVGTNNEALLNDDLYLGWRSPRIRGERYDEFVAEFVSVVKKRFPKVLLQWEDFGKINARRLLDRYREEILSFNDDIQGTAAVVLAALLVAMRAQKKPLKEQRVAILGGGSAGTGIADMIVTAMMNEGLSVEEASERIYIVDREGLISSRSKALTDAQKIYAHSEKNLKNWKTKSEGIDLLDVVSNTEISVLIGVCAQSGSFTQKIVSQVAKNVERPIIFPLSNPTTKAECTPDEVFEWTNGKAIVATGSPFPPVNYQGKTYQISQCNNVYIFPGLGVGALAAGAKMITDKMLLEASISLSSQSPALKDPTAPLFPPIEEVRGVSRNIALAVAKVAVEEKQASEPSSSLEKRIDEICWDPHYPTYI